MKVTRLAAAVVAAGLTLAVWGCSGQKEFAVSSPEETCVIVRKDGSVSLASVENYQSGEYSAEELLEFAKEQISEYNASLGKGDAAENKEGAEKLPAAVVSASIENNRAVLVTEYDSPESLLAFAGEIGDTSVTFTDLKTGTVSGMEGLESVVWKKPGGEIEPGQTVEKKQDAQVIRAEGSGVIKTEKKVQYISNGCELTDEHTVRTAAESPSYIVLK